MAGNNSSILITNNNNYPFPFFPIKMEQWRTYIVVKTHIAKQDKQFKAKIGKIQPQVQSCSLECRLAFGKNQYLVGQ